MQEKIIKQKQVGNVVYSLRKKYDGYFIFEHKIDQNTIMSGFTFVPERRFKTEDSARKCFNQLIMAKNKIFIRK